MGVVCGEAFECVGKFFSKNIQFEVGVGNRVKLWIDQWCGDSPLQLTFPIVYGIASNKGASVAFSLGPYHIHNLIRCTYCIQNLNKLRLSSKITKYIKKFTNKI